MRWLYGDRITTQYDNGAFESGPIRLNVDDIAEIILLFREVDIHSPKITCAPLGDGMDTYREVSDLATASVAEVYQVRISGEIDAAEQSKWTILGLQISPDGLRIEMVLASPERREPMTKVLSRIKSIVQQAPRGSLPAQRKALLVTSLINIALLTALIICWTWLALSWNNWAGRVMAAIVVALAFKTAMARSGPFEQRFRRSPKRWWLDQQSRAELYKERANTRRDIQVGLRVGFITGIVGTTLGALLTALLEN
ncbi:hypothetical protein KBX53_17025 [Micromonospora sp. M51]|uniref:hypothetical protein n=1 Tax=Micromonospora TaxID=1873 RepID=UPI001B389D30|nr:hypothetical protein [Micromonospora sp. M51]MBQ1012628.1 hypothetical protein [Micromonospora sp. M51]